MNKEVRALAAEFKAFLSSREEDDLTPAACNQAAACISATGEAASDTTPSLLPSAAETQPQDHLTIEFAHVARSASTGSHCAGNAPTASAPSKILPTAHEAAAASSLPGVRCAEAVSMQTAQADTQDKTEASHSLMQETPMTPQEKQAALDQLAEEIKNCRRCPLGQTRLNAVPGEGNPAAELMFIGEGPGFDEDHQGRPFIGRAGQLLDKMIAAMGLKREQVFIGNIAKCHPMVNPADPQARGNDRAPNAGEIAVCRKYIERQIAIISPKYIVALGGVAAKALISDTKSLGALRGKFHLLHLDTVELKTPVKILATYHPAALLRNPGWKKDAWADLQMVMAEMGLKRPQA